MLLPPRQRRQRTLLLLISATPKYIYENAVDFLIAWPAGVKLQDGNNEKPDDVHHDMDDDRKVRYCIELLGDPAKVSVYRI